MSELVVWKVRRACLDATLQAGAIWPILSIAISQAMAVSSLVGLRAPAMW